MVAGEHVLASYLQGRGDDLIKFRVGGRVWHRTGDAGCRDHTGRLWLLGRCSARVGALYPLAVEAAVSGEAGVHRAAFFVNQGRRLLAIEPEPGGPSPRLEDIHRRLAWADLDEVRLTRCIPVDRRHNAKIDYTALAADSAAQDFPLPALR